MVLFYHTLFKFYKKETIKIPWKKRDKTTNCWSVYRHTTPSGGVYIGITGNPVKKRWQRGKGYEKCPAFSKAIQKYGWENIQHEVLFENLYKEEADKKEKELIEYYKTYGHCYNVADGGSRDFVSEETKEKMRKNRQGKNSHAYGKKWSQESRNLTSQAIKGIKRSDKTKQALKDSHSRKLYQYDADGNLIGIWSSSKQASFSTGHSLSSINRCRLYYKNNLCGYIWLDEFIKDKKLLQKYYNGDILIPVKKNVILKKVVQLDDNYKIVAIYSSIKKAAKATDTIDTQIIYSCQEFKKNGTRKIAGGYYWEYLPKESYYYFDSYFLYYATHQNEAKDLTLKQEKDKKHSLESLTSGGIRMDNSRNQWGAYLCLGSKYKYIGRYNTKEEACENQHLAALKFLEEQNNE